MTLEVNRIYNEDCIGERGMALIADGSVDMVLCDLPYGTTACKWDTVIDFGKLWGQYERIVKPTGAIVLTASQPFTSALIMSNPKMFKYCWVWDKVGISNPMLAKKQPLKNHEDICVFYKKQCIYKPQMTNGKQWSRGGKKEHNTDTLGNSTLINNGSDKTDIKYPKSIIQFSNANKINNTHPTQKPVALGEYLIRTYTNAGDVVLDNTCGVGSFPVAAVNTGRNFIGFELDKGYYDIACERIKSAQETMASVG